MSVKQKCYDTETLKKIEILEIKKLASQIKSAIEKSHQLKWIK